MCIQRLTRHAFAGCVPLLFALGAHASTGSTGAGTACYAAIERVYYEQRDWPDKSAPKPPFEDAYPDSTFAARVDNDLRMETALGNLRGAPLTDAEVQAELDRVVSHSRDAETLKRIFAGLGNDPRRIAECLARPLIVRRLLRQRYAESVELHAGERARALDGYARLQAGTMLGDASVRQVWASADTDALTLQRLRKSPLATIGAADVPVVERHYAGLVRALGLDTGAGPEVLEARAGFTSPLTETESAFTALRIERGADGMQVSQYTWPKRPFEDWWRDEQIDLPPMTSGLAGTFHLAPADTGECLIAEWIGPTKVIDDYQPRYSAYADAVWTGTEMTVYGYGQSGIGAYEPAIEGGVRFNPVTNTWSVMNDASEPTSSYPGAAWRSVWSGSRLVVMGCPALDTSGTCNLRGGRYDPATDTWSALNVEGAVTPNRSDLGPKLYWTGSTVLSLVPYTSTSGGELGSYDPVTDTWQLLASPPQSDGSGKYSAIKADSAVWTGTELVVAGYSNCNGICGILQMQIYIYNQATNQWRSVTNYGTNLSNRNLITLAWTGSEVIFWGGDEPTLFTNGYYYGVPTNTGAKFNPSTNTWTAMSVTGAPTARDAHVAQWAGSKLVIWGGEFTNPDNTENYPATGGLYLPSSNTWVPTQSNGAPFPRTYALSVWTGSEVIVWGGGVCTSTSAGSDNLDCNSGGRFNPSSNSWTPLLVHGSDGALTARDSFSIAGSGSDALVFGGNDGYQPNTDSALYRPATDDWLRVPTVGEPSLRTSADSGWSGSNYIVWGGTDSNTGQPLTDGARFDPVAQIWTPMAAVPATFLSHRYSYTHAAGANLYLWGGANDQTGAQYNDGIVYVAATNTWSALPGMNAPDARLQPLSSVDGSGNFVLWGGYDQSTGTYPTTGAVYRQSTNAWTAIQAVGSVPTSPNQGDFQDIGWASSSHVGFLADGDAFVWDQTIATGWRYEMTSAQWQTINAAGAPPATNTGSQSMLPTPRDVLFFGGSVGDTNPPPYLSGYAYHPNTDAWSTLPTSRSPEPRAYQAAVAIGNQMMIWGGINWTTSERTGGLYCLDARSGELSADVSFDAQFATDPIALGSPGTLDVQASNAGPDTATDVDITIDATTDFAFDQMETTEADCTTPTQGSSGAIVCHVGTLVPGASAEVVIALSAYASGRFGVHGSVQGAEPDPSNGNNEGDAFVTVLEAGDSIFSSGFDE